MRVTTTRCAAHQHPEFVLDGDERINLTRDLRWLATFLEESVAEGTRYAPGETIQLGFTVLRVEPAEDDKLCLHEPDESGWPLNYVRSVSRAMFFLRHMKDTVDSFGLLDALEFPNVLQSAIICTEVGERPVSFMTRMPPEGDDSGWILVCGDPEHDHEASENLMRVSLYDVALRQHEATAFFAMPTDCSIALGEDGIVHATQGEEELAIRPGSYLAARLAREPRH